MYRVGYTQHMKHGDKVKALRAYIAAYDAYQCERVSVLALGGEMVRYLRGLTKMSVRKFAVAMNVSPSYLSKVERGTETLSPELARTICTLLEMNE